ncbi:MAG: hydrogenase maturation protease [Thiohalocapsa sp.]
MRDGRRIVVGIGNPLAGDDAVGRLVVRALRQRAPPAADLVECDGEAGALLDLLREAEVALLVDAGRFGAAAGTIRRLDALTETIPAPQIASTHGFGLSQAVALARVLGWLPRRCLLYLIEGSCWTSAAPLSPPVADAVPLVAAMLSRELGAENSSWMGAARG